MGEGGGVVEEEVVSEGEGHLWGVRLGEGGEAGGDGWLVEW